MRILIFTSGKTGSSALAGSLQKVLPDHELIFEPSRLSHIDDGKSNIIVKSLAALHYGTEVDKFPTYDKRIFLVRHPFDRLISALLYAPFNGNGFDSDENARRYLDLIRLKVEKREPVSVIRIAELFHELSGFDLMYFIGEEVRCHKEFTSTYSSDFLTVRYEDLIAGNRGEIEEYMGFSLEGELSVPKGFERVRRNCRSGDWTEWFLESDREFFAAKWSEYFEVFSFYSLKDKLNLCPDISKNSSWGYVLKMINAFRVNGNLDPCIY